MAFLNCKMQQEQHKFDWDDINVGNSQLDDSQNFFSKKHYEHERVDEMEFLQQKMIKTELNESIENKENIKANFTSPVQKSENKLLDEHLSPSIVKVEDEECAASPVDVNKEPQDGRELCLKVAPNLACEWSTKKTICSQAVGLHKGAISKNVPPPPQAYLVKDIYQRNREEAERRRAEEERKMREFHSRPAPNFNHHHELLQKRKPAHAVTVAVTPQVLKKSREAEEKRRKRLEEWKQKNQVPKFEPRPPTVLKEKPFVPEKKPMVVQMCPFKLHTEKRLQERKHYDEIKQKALEEKQKQEEEERKKLEKERIKELRKAATFKARPNPFKN
ncbi:nexilin isoform X2 [Lucilia cuprina]|uniref:nexilin isoform X2 n=1 Tax=Lucilia cuprina TaxID=7375 RepID=UPI001F05126E|nr:nexilin isoform X2 [Lucilia cuprina]